MTKRIVSPTEPAELYRVPALDKGLDVLECLATHGVPMTQAQVARTLGRGSSELFRTLTTLERRGYLSRDMLSGTYSLTLRLFELGHTHSPFDGLLRVADIPMRTLAEAVKSSCHLTVLDGDSLVVLHQAESRERVRVSVDVGSAIQPYRAASGRLLIAFSDAETGNRMLADLPPDERDDALKRLDKIRGRGHETARGESVDGLCDLSVLVGHPDGTVRAALAVTALVRKKFQDEWVEQTLPHLRAAADAMSRAAGLVVAASSPEE